MEDGVGQRIDQLIADIGDVSAPVQRALRAVPRHHFIPPVALAHPRGDHVYGIVRDTTPTTWWNTVYTDTAIVTQLDDGRTPLTDVIGEDGTVDTGRAGNYTSSASAPSTVTDLLELLAPAPGHRVLEIGTGTGWTAALLSHLVGEVNVTSIEVDPAIAEQAAKNLASATTAPHLVVGDGADGHPERAPYDRVHVTCGIRTVPYAWIEQTRPGGVIVLPYCPDFGEDHSLRLTVTPDGTAHGRFPGFASYMPMRSQRVPGDRPARSDDDKHHLTTRIDPRTIAYAPAGADLAIATLTGLTSLGRPGSDEDGDLYRLWVSDPADPCRWATAVWRPGEDEYKVYQVGNRPVWEETVAAYFRWLSWGAPNRDRFGMTVTPEGQRIWLDTPDQVIT